MTNRLFNLPEDLQRKVYEYDNTPRDVYNTVMRELIMIDEEEFCNFIEGLYDPPPVYELFNCSYFPDTRDLLSESIDISSLRYKCIKSLKCDYYEEYIESESDPDVYGGVFNKDEMVVYEHNVHETKVLATVRRFWFAKGKTVFFLNFNEWAGFENTVIRRDEDAFLEEYIIKFI
jgi:hypothetical protein